MCSVILGFLEKQEYSIGETLWGILALALPAVNLLTIIGLMIRSSVRAKILISVVFIVMSANFIKSTLDALAGRKRFDEAQKRERELVQERDLLKRQLEYKRTQEYIEESARNELNLIKPGEKVYVLENSAQGETDGQYYWGQTDAEGVVAAAADEEKYPNWYYWYKLFF